jgi:hypothetical protein
LVIKLTTVDHNQPRPIPTMTSPATNAPAPVAQPLVAAADAQPPTVAQTVLDQTTATIQTAKDTINGLLGGKPAATATDLHPSEGPAAPLLAAAEAMPPTAAQKTLDEIKAAVVGTPAVSDIPTHVDSIDKVSVTNPLTCYNLKRL